MVFLLFHIRKYQQFVNFYTKFFTTAFCSLILSRGPQIAIIASAQIEGSRSLHTCLWRCGIFDSSIQLSPPRPDQRADILRRLCGPCKGGIDWGEAAERTEGCRPSDLLRIARRAQHAAVLRKMWLNKEFDGNQVRVKRNFTYFRKEAIAI